MSDSLGIYISVPFCQAKCTFCNFASDVFAAGSMDAYVARLCGEMRAVHRRAAAMGAVLPAAVDTIYFGGGTPSLLEAEHFQAVFVELRGQFAVKAGAESTLECAPGQLADETLEALLQLGLNRVSLGVQSFVDAEAAAVGRRHTRTMCLTEIARLRAAGVANLSVDLIVGLPGQTEASWRFSVEEAIATAVPHISIYMLEVDGESRLGREALAGGKRYGAGSLPEDEAVADWYQLGCNLLEAAGVGQYEISNFAREGMASRHNVKYWRREPYLGFGLDAHSMLRASASLPGQAVRFANTAEMGEYLAGPNNPFAGQRRPELVGREAAFEEALFLGLRMNTGISLGALRTEHGRALVEGAESAMGELQEAGLVWREGNGAGLTKRGRVLSNEVFERMLVAAAV